MKCKICGGTLKVVDGFYVCENCHNKVEITSVYENTEVTICYVEFDDAGRRTKDSVVAQEIYTKLSSLDIAAFYHRVSAGNLSAQEAQKAYDYAKSNAKILIVLAGSKENFSKLITDNETLLQQKKIIPVYFDINAYDLPKELSIYQALNYDNIGAIQDLSKNVLKTLGRDNEVDLVEERAKVLSKKKKVTLIVSLSLVALLVISALYIILGTPYVLPGKKYDKAEDLVAEEKYVEAIDMLNSLGDYENSEDMLANLYAQYAGYYLNTESNVGLHIDTSGIVRADITITEVTQENGIVKIIESASFTNNIVSFEYNDSQNNQGSAVVKFKNDGIELTLTSESERTIFFALSEKSDQPIINLDGKTLMNWLDTKITMSQIEALGYELEEYSLMERDGLNRLYKIKNTDVIVALYGWDLSTGLDRGNGEPTDRILFGIMAPAEIVCPNDIGKEYIPFVKDDTMYWPGGKVGESGNGLTFWSSEENNESQISADTEIALASKKALTDDNWRSITKSLLEAKVNKFAKEYYKLADGEWGHAVYRKENDTHALFAFNSDGLNDRYAYALFKINKDTHEVSFVDEAPKKLNSWGGLEEVEWTGDF